MDHWNHRQHSWLHINHPIRWVEVELEESLEIVSGHGIYAYDAYLIRYALKHKSILLTLDQKLADLANSIGVEVVEVDR